MRSAYALGIGLAILLGGTAQAQQGQPAAPPTTPLKVIIVIQTQPGTGGVTVTPAVTSPGLAPTGNAAVRPIRTGVATPTAPVTYKPSDRFGALDTNKDGKLGLAEFKGSKAEFASVDADHDGFVSKPEATRAYLAFVGRLAIREKARAYEAMDTDKDGKLSAAEFKGPKPLFAAIDANHDGAISKAEAARAFARYVRGAMGVARLIAMDTNKDHKLSPTEFKGSVAQFLKLDVDKDGVITRAEVSNRFKHAIAAWPEAAPAKAPTVKPVSAVTPVTAPAAGTCPSCTGAKSIKTTKVATPAKPVTVAARAPGNGLKAMLAAFDTDKDGKVCKTEFLKGMEARFSRLDRDKDGSITQADVTRVLQARAAKPAPTVKKATMPATISPESQAVKTTKPKKG